MSKFASGLVVFINDREFKIASVSKAEDGREVLTGSLKGDPSYLAGKRKIYAAGLVEVEGDFNYEF